MTGQIHNHPYYYYSCRPSNTQLLPRTHTHTHTHAHTHTSTHTHINIHTYVHMHTHPYAHTLIHSHIHVQAPHACSPCCLFYSCTVYSFENQSHKVTLTASTSDWLLIFPQLILTGKILEITSQRELLHCPLQEIQVTSPLRHSSRKRYPLLQACVVFS